jgi:hypothetical protein
MKRKLPKASPALAKSVWQSQKRPSTRSVATALTAAGYPIDFTTVARWKRQDWQSNSNEDHPLDMARAKLEGIAPLATGEPTLAEASNENRAEQVSDATLLRQEAARLSAVSVQVWSAAEPKLEKLVRRRTGELALLVQALAECGEAAANALSQAEKMEQAPPLSGGVARQGNETR